MPTITGVGDSRVLGVSGGKWSNVLMSRFGHESLVASQFSPWSGGAGSNQLTGNGYVFYNAGISSETSAQVRARWSTDVLGHHSDYIICDFGVNDAGDNRAAEDIIADSEWMFDSARANCSRLFITTIMPWTGGTAAQKDIIDAVNVARLSYAAAHPDVVLVDLYTVFEATPGSRTLNPTYSADGLHLNDAGHAVEGALFDLADLGYGAPREADVQIQIAAGEDDVLNRKTTAAFAAASTTMYLGNTSETAKNYGDSLRFINVSIPRDAKIASARVLLTSMGNYTNTTAAAKVRGWAADNSPRITTTGGFDTAFAAGTTAVVDWPSIGAWSAEVQYATPDLTAVIQEIVNRAGWVSGNALTIFLDDYDNRSSTGAVRQFYAYNLSAPKSAVLEVFYKRGALSKKIAAGVI